MWGLSLENLCKTDFQMNAVVFNLSAAFSKEKIGTIYCNLYQQKAPEQSRAHGWGGSLANKVQGQNSEGPWGLSKEKHRSGLEVHCVQFQ